MALLIGVSGVSCSGRGELSRSIQEKLEGDGHRVSLVVQDNFDTNASRVRLPPEAPPQAAYEYTESIDFDRFLGAVNDACARSQIVIVEGFRVFHESDPPKHLANWDRPLTEAMKVRIWLEISQKTCHQRRNATRVMTEGLFDQALWPCHMKYKEDVLANVSNGVTGPLLEINGEQALSQVFEQAMEHIAPFLLTVAQPRNGKPPEKEKTPDRVFNPSRDIIKEGWIYKRSRWLKVWRTRWGVLTRERFQTFKTQSQFFNGRSTEDFPMRHCISADDGMTDGEGYMMFVQIGGRKGRMIQLKTDTENERSEWLSCIKETMRSCTDENTAARDNADQTTNPNGQSTASGYVSTVRAKSPPRTGVEYLVSNALGSDNDGLLYRRSKDLDDKDVKVAAWGSVVIGESAGHGWIKAGHLYLPTELRGVPVLMPVSS
jgi:hypothetical protein